MFTGKTGKNIRVKKLYKGTTRKNKSFNSDYTYPEKTMIIRVYFMIKAPKYLKLLKQTAVMSMSIKTKNDKIIKGLIAKLDYKICSVRFTK